MKPQEELAAIMARLDADGSLQFVGEFCERLQAPQVVIARWITRGRQRADGARVCLDGRQRAGLWLTSAAAVERFLAAGDWPPQLRPRARKHGPPGRGEAPGRRRR